MGLDFGLGFRVLRFDVRADDGIADDFFIFDRFIYQLQSCSDPPILYYYHYIILGIASSALAGSTLQVGVSGNAASLYRTNSQYSGRVALDCTGGSGSYRFEITNLPSGWTAQNNVINVPNINGVMGDFTIGVKVTDSAANVFQGNVKISINGINVVVASDVAQASTGSVSGSASLPIASAPVVTPQVIAPNPAVAALYESYPGLPVDTAPAVSADGRYPTAPPPSGKPAGPNIISSIISNAQAPYNAARDAKQITVDQVKRNAAFNRQLNANKAVANLISIIQQLTANVNAAKNDISVVQITLSNLQSSNNDCNNKIYDLSNSRAKIQNATKDKQDKIAQTNKKISDLAPIINDLTKIKNDLVTKRTQIQSTRSPNADKLSYLEKLQKDCNTGSDTVQKQIDDINNQVNGWKNDIKNAQDQAASAPAAITLIEQQVPIVDAKIADLKKQLQDAQNQKNKLLQDKLKYEQTIDTANRKVRDLQRKVDDLLTKIPSLDSQLSSQKSKCDNITKQIDDLRAQISQKQTDYKTLQQQIKTQDGLLNDRKDENKKYSDSVTGLNNQISALVQELSRVEETIRRQYYVCNDAADSVRKAKQSSDALNTKYTTQSGWLKDANDNLEKARAEKDLADQAVSEIIAASTNALPFAVTPSPSVASTGTPTGNNPSGSAVLPQPASTTVPATPDSVVVGDINNYITKTYGANVDPRKLAGLTTLFPISMISGRPYGLTGSQDITCSATGGLVQGQGQVLSVEPGQITLSQTNGGQITLKVSDCSKLYSVQNNYSIAPKSNVVYKGVQRGSTVQLQHLVCI